MKQKQRFLFVPVTVDVIIMILSALVVTILLCIDFQIFIFGRACLVCAVQQFLETVATLRRPCIFVTHSQGREIL